MNADDWGRDRETTQRTWECIRRGAVSSVSAMIFMKDSERAASVARESGIDVGLHLNFTTSFSSENCPASLLEHQQKIAAFLLRRPISRMVFHPGLVRSFEYVVSAQREEFARLYGAEAERFDGHHHMHLCANVLLGKLLPTGTRVRRHFAYESREKAVRNYVFRKFTDAVLVQRHRVVDYFFSLPPLAPPGRLQGILALARHSLVELETHPVNPEEYRFLAHGEIFRLCGELTATSVFDYGVESRHRSVGVFGPQA
ncbi:MAG: ChbG/HpnK family deacetylase [Terriglobales bacterium]